MRSRTLDGDERMQASPRVDRDSLVGRHIKRELTQSVALLAAVAMLILLVVSVFSRL